VVITQRLIQDHKNFDAFTELESLEFKVPVVCLVTFKVKVNGPPDGRF
jgi:hypothetical protein